MRRVPSVNPEELRKLCKLTLGKRPGCGVDATSFRISVDACVRYLELRRRFRLSFAYLLPRFIQKVVFRIAATVPLESRIPEMIEEQQITSRT
jgi:hypothetical protein